MDIFLFLIYIFNLLNFSFEYYDMKFGHIFMNYYPENASDCTGPYRQVVYSIEDEKKLYFLNKESNIVGYNYSFDFFSTTVYYSRTEDEEEEDDKKDDTRRGILCNGLCYKRIDGTNILEPSEIKFAPDFETEDKISKYYSCVYNNIIKNATIKLLKYSDKNCKNKLEADSGTFRGNQSCWGFNSYSYRPLYFEDDGKRVYYHLYKSHNDCTSNYYEYFDFNGFYFECDDGCYQDKNDPSKYYICEFNNSEIIKISNQIFLYLILFIFIFI